MRCRPQATHQIGHGRGFGLHERSIDRRGSRPAPCGRPGHGVADGSLSLGLGILLAPALLTLGTLAIAWRAVPGFPSHFEGTPNAWPVADRLPPPFWLYMVASGLIAAGYADFPLIAYHFGRQGVIPAGGIPLVYAMAMAVDAIAAPSSSGSGSIAGASAF